MLELKNLGSARRTEELLVAENLAAVTGGRLVGRGGLASGISTDTRSLRRGDLFFALQGENFDGHHFLGRAVEAGASGLVISEARSDFEPPEDVFVVRVPDPAKALGDLAAAWRSLCDLKVVGITGSCGKTSTKEMARHLLAPHLSLVAAPRSFNNRIGLPLTLFACNHRTELCLLELGANAPGEIAGLAAIARPDIALLTLVGRAHLEGFGSVKGVLREKLALVRALPPTGTAIFNADSAHVPACIETAKKVLGGKARILTFGVSRKADLEAHGLRPRMGGVDFELRIRGEEADRLHLQLPRPGLHNVRNCMAAMAVGVALGIHPEFLLPEVATLPVPPRRLEPKPSRLGALLLDDCYNANPESLLAALAVLDSWSGVRRRILVLGDMLELGPDSAAIHRGLSRDLLGGRVDALVAVGPLARHTFKTFTAGGGKATSFPEAGAALPFLEGTLREGDLVLFKASRRIGLDRLVDALL